MGPRAAREGSERGKPNGGERPVVDIAAEIASDEEVAMFLVTDDADWESEVTRPTNPGPARTTREELVFPVAVRVAPDGDILEGTDADLADAVAYAGPLAALIGDLLGLEGFRGIECVTAPDAERLIVYPDQRGGLVAGRFSAATDVAVLRDWLDL